MINILTPIMVSPYPEYIWIHSLRTSASEKSKTTQRRVPWGDRDRHQSTTCYKKFRTGWVRKPVIV